MADNLDKAKQIAAANKAAAETAKKQSAYEKDISDM